MTYVTTPLFVEYREESWQDKEAKANASKVIGALGIVNGINSTDIPIATTTLSKSKAMTYLTTPLFVYCDAPESIVEYQGIES